MYTARGSLGLRDAGPPRDLGPLDEGPLGQTDRGYTTTTTISKVYLVEIFRKTLFYNTPKSAPQN